MIAETSAPDKAMTSMYALGWTQHSKGSQNIRSMAMLQLILGNIGVRGGGVNALRGHSNIQGLTDMGLMSNLIPGYLAIPTDKEPDFATYAAKRAFKPERPNQMSYWQNYKKFFINFQKAMWGDAATAENELGLSLSAQARRACLRHHPRLRIDEPGQDQRLFLPGLQPAALGAEPRQGASRAFQAQIPGEHGPAADRNRALLGEPRRIQPHEARGDPDQPSSSFPTTCFAEDEGSLSNSGRWIQWHWAGGTPPGEAKPDAWIMAQLHNRLKALYEKEGGAYAEPILKVTWPYADPGEPAPLELAREINGYVLADVPDPADPAKLVLQKGKRVTNFAALRDDGTTACGCWIYSGCYNESGNNMARRDTTDPDSTGAYLKWAFSWPANRRILYNRASANLEGKAWDPKRKLIEWNGEKWTGYDVPDIAPTAKPDQVGPFIMNPEGVGRLFAKGMKDGPFPSHYEPFESPVANLVAPKIRGNPVARVFKSDLESLGTAAEFPYAGTSYRVAEHFHFWSKHGLINAALQPEFFVEISEELAKEKGIEKGGWVRVWSKRGSIKAKALVTKRIKPLLIDGKPVHVVGIPLNWGFTGAAKKGFGPNSLTYAIGDANIETPESKAFLVNIEPINQPVA